VSDKCALILEQKASYQIQFMCDLLRLPRSTFYEFTTRSRSATAMRHDELTETIRDLFWLHKRRYGARRLAQALRRAGTPAALGTIATIMRAENLVTVQPRAWKRTTIQAPGLLDRRDRIKRVFNTRTPGTRFVGDITYLRTGQGWLYLATVIDLCSRMVVGWQLADHMRSSIVTDALDMAADGGFLNSGHALGVVFHSDRGSVYTSEDVERWATAHDVILSCGAIGVCWDNAVAESFFATLKNEMYYQTEFATRAQARTAIVEYIEVYYNRKRFHSTLDYLTPLEAHRAAELHQADETFAA
jgi:transposase InsO family protein